MIPSHTITTLSLLLSTGLTAYAWNYHPDRKYNKRQKQILFAYDLLLFSLIRIVFGFISLNFF